MVDREDKEEASAVEALIVVMVVKVEASVVEVPIVVMVVTEEALVEVEADWVVIVEVEEVVAVLEEVAALENHLILRAHKQTHFWIQTEYVIIRFNRFN